MPLFLKSWLLSLASSAVALLLAWLVFSSTFHIDIPAFIIAVVVFSVLNAVLSWIVFKTLRKYGRSLIALSGLISTFLALFVTALISSGLHIDGIGTWVGATVLIWIVSIVIWAIPGPWRSLNRERAARAE